MWLKGNIRGFRFRDFNSHTREGVTISAYILPRKLQFQLTHPWGCDLIEIMLLPKTEFQLTHPWGCDNSWNSWKGLSYGFQLTHPWGCDLMQPTSLEESSNFNSHTREGVTWLVGISTKSWKFQLTHPWGCDAARLMKSGELSISTHTPVRVWR